MSSFYEKRIDLTFVHNFGVFIIDEHVIFMYSDKFDEVLNYVEKLKEGISEGG